MTEQGVSTEQRDQVNEDVGYDPEGRVVVTNKDGVAVGIISLGFLALVLPWASTAVGDLEFVPGEPYGILIGTVYVLGVFLILAGLAVFRLRDR